MKPDFSLLYSELDLPPDCSLEEFQCAYRRRIAVLHPDKAGIDPPSPEAQAALPALISTYVAVNRFHRRYGRMPGGSPRHVPDTRHFTGNHLSGNHLSGNGSAPVQPGSRSNLPISAPTGDESEGSSRPTVRLVILFIALLLLLASWDWVTLQAQ